MPSVEQLRSRLVKKLKELFQLDQPDLDFGFYRIMHAKSKQVLEFIENDLLTIVADAFGQMDETRRTELQNWVDEALNQAMMFGAPDPEVVPAVMDARARYASLGEQATLEGDVYDHLYRFFERYYDNGDFISRRYFVRETSGRAAPFAIPYFGEEIKLHWANADQYYIKTAEYFSSFTIDLKKHLETLPETGMPEQQKLGFDRIDVPDSLKMHFRIVEATEGEHGNVKASEQNRRFFVIHRNRPTEFNDAWDLTVNFEYRIDPEKTGPENSWRDKRNTESVETILKALLSPDAHPLCAIYHQILTLPAPTESNRDRPLLARYINQYTSRNTMDYFIHKDLGSFLRRELDFYIKNEVMRLDDICNADAPVVETYLSRLKVLRKIAGKLIDFLAQLEDFQKKLWLKKKFVVETNYCITLDRIPEALYPEIAANQAQHDEWVRLFAIDEIPGQLFSAAYSHPLTEVFLKQNDKLVLDTRFFDESFKARLLASIENLDEQCDGLMIHSENFQALNLLQERYRGQVKCVYIDPPYNTSASEIIYKNEYKHSSWLTLIFDRLSISTSLMDFDANLCATIDDVELNEFCLILDSIFGRINEIAIVPIRINPSGRPSEVGFALTHEYALFYGKSLSSRICRVPRSQDQLARFNQKDQQGIFEYRNLRREGSNSDRIDGQRQYFPIYANLDNGTIRVPVMHWSEVKRKWIISEEPQGEEVVIYPVNDDGREKNWRWSEENIRKDYSQFLARVPRGGTPQVYYKYRPRTEGTTPLTLWTDTKYSATEQGTRLLKNLFNNPGFSYPKSIYAVEDCLRVGGATDKKNINILDYFAGSGTTGHAVINLNREDGGSRRYILVEMGDYFDTVLKPRIAKVIYSDTWKDGKPVNRNTGISQCFKYLRLESYEDTLNNLRFDENPLRDQAIARNPALQEDYMLHYLLDVETRGSQSLLNIDEFTDPTAYTLKIKKPGTEEVSVCHVDLMETFNYLIGLHVTHIAHPQMLTAKFKRVKDKEVPNNQHTRLVLNGNPRQVQHNRNDKPVPVWWFRKIEGWVSKDPLSADNGHQEKVLIVWRKLTGDLEKDNLMLDTWFLKNRINPRDFEYNTIYTNGSNNLPNLRTEGETWKVNLIEETFFKRMWEQNFGTGS